MTTQNEIAAYDPSKLSDEAKGIIEVAASATGTIKQYRSDYKVFIRWLTQVGGHAAHPTHIDLINFMAAQLSGKLTEFKGGRLVDGGMIAPATIDRRRWGIVKTLKAKGISFTAEQLDSIAEYMRKVKMQPEQRKPAKRRGQSAPLRWADVELLMQSDMIERQTTFVRLRNKALLAFMAVTGCRESEALGENGIRLRDFTFEPNHIRYFRMVLKQGLRSYSFEGFVGKGKNASTCPYMAIKNYHELVSKHPLSTPDTKLFLRANNQGRPYVRMGSNQQLVAMGERSVDDFLRNAAISAGLGIQRAKQISGHSIRMGLVVGNVEKGMTFEQISQITGQSVSTVERYAKQARMNPFNGELN